MAEPNTLRLTQVFCSLSKYFVADTKHMGQPQGTRVRHETAGTAINYIEQPRNTWDSVKLLGTVMEHLDKPMDEGSKG